MIKYIYAEGITFHIIELTTLRVQVLSNYNMLLAELLEIFHIK